MYVTSICLQIFLLLFHPTIARALLQGQTVDHRCVCTAGAIPGTFVYVLRIGQGLRVKPVSTITSWCVQLSVVLTGPIHHGTAYNNTIDTAADRKSGFISQQTAHI